LAEVRYPEVLVDVPLEVADEAAAVLFELGATGVEQRDEATLVKGAAAGRATLVASFDDRGAAERAAAELEPAWHPRVSELVGDAWRDEWKKHFAPFRLTKTITIRPPWHADETKEPADVVLELEPGRAFGTGLHATTALVARALEDLGASLAGRRVLDVGTGSGILALVALALGAAYVRAVDVDPDAVEVTIENAIRNGMRDRIEADTTPVAAIDETFDVVIANIEARVLVELAPVLHARVGADGILLLSGILVGQESDVTRAFPSLVLRNSETEGEWIMLVLEARRIRL
jgi:ribosomal protein L11 methyltransferase